MTENKSSELAVPTTGDEFRDLLTRAAKGDRSVLPVLGKLLQDPAYVEMFGGNLASTVEAFFVKELCGKDLTVSEAVRTKLASLRKELLGPDPSPLERLLVERVAACWLQVQDAEVRFAQNRQNLSISQGDYHQRRMDATNRRYRAAIKALALVRKLAMPALQINVARKQVNVVAQPGIPAS
jgi:hypothetical protein